MQNGVCHHFRKINTKTKHQNQIMFGPQLAFAVQDQRDLHHINHREYGNQTYLVSSHISHRNFSLPIYHLSKWHVCKEYFENKTSFFLWRLESLLIHTAVIPHYRNCTTRTFIQPFALTSLMAALSSSPGRTSLFPVNFMESPKSLMTQVPSFFTSTLRLFRSRWDIAGL